MCIRDRRGREAEAPGRGRFEDRRDDAVKDRERERERGYRDSSRRGGDGDGRKRSASRDRAGLDGSSRHARHDGKPGRGGHRRSDEPRAGSDSPEVSWMGAGYCPKRRILGVSPTG